MSAYISPVLYKQYCRVTWLEDNDDSLRRFLREVGTHSVTFSDGGGEYRTVPPGTCVRLYTSDKYSILSNRYLNLYSTLYTKQDEVRGEPKTTLVVPTHKPTWWCSLW